MSRRKRKLPEPAEATIESLSHEGRGVAHLDGKTVFIDYALPGETVRFEYLKQHSKRDEGAAIAINNASPHRVEAKCPHFTICGGCSLQHMSAEAQIEHKQKVLLEQLRHIGNTEPESLLEPLRGPIWAYRHKARLGVKYVIKKEKLLVGFREKRNVFVADIDSCDILHPSVGKIIPQLKDIIGRLSIYNFIPQIEVAVGHENTALIIRHKQPFIENDIELLREFEQRHGIMFYLQSGGIDTVVALTAEHARDLYYRFDEEDITISFSPLDFTQVNMEINRSMLQQVIALLEPQAQDKLLDLFCGLGNFTLPLAKRVEQITGVEGEKILVEKARNNAERNNIQNATFHHADLYKEGIQNDVLKQSYDKILLDPPRSGAQEVLEAMNFKKVERVVYVSCNPATLARDTAILVQQHGYRLVKAGVMDMFPHTTHVESVALFQR